MAEVFLGENGRCAAQKSSPFQAVTDELIAEPILCDHLSQPVEQDADVGIPLVVVQHEVTLLIAFGNCRSVFEEGADLLRGKSPEQRKIP